MAESAFDPAGIMSPQIFGLPVDREALFSDHKKIYKKRIERRQRKLIIKLAFLKPFLKKGEKILLISTGYSPLASAAQYLTGFVFVYLKRSLFVFTNYRLLHIPTTATYKYKGTIAQIAYAGCRSIALKGGTLVVVYSKGDKVERFKGQPISERKKIKALLQGLPLSDPKDGLSARIYLCPQCGHYLTAGTFNCENCQLKFKSRLWARIISIIFPGGGYFYARHYLIGFVNAFLELFLLAYIAYVATTLAKTQNEIQDSIHLIGLTAIYLCIKIISVIHSNDFVNEFIPKDKTFKQSGSSLVKKKKR